MAREKLKVDDWPIFSAVFWQQRYPVTFDCKEIDLHINQIQEDILFIQTADFKNSMNIGLPPLPKPKFNGQIDFSIGARQIELAKRMNKPKIALSDLRAILVAKENAFANGDCRNKIETIRQEETAEIFTESSQNAETRILGSSEKKQYIYIAVGAATILTALVLILRKK